MSKGRPIKPVSEWSGNQTKDEIKERKELEEDLNGKYKKLQSTPPTRFRGEGEIEKIARSEWNRVYPELEKMPVSTLDRVLLEEYCLYYAIFMSLADKVIEQGTVVTNRHGEEVDNPIIKTMRGVGNDIKNIAPLLGMTIDSRMKMEIQDNELKDTNDREKDIFDLFKR